MPGLLLCPSVLQTVSISAPVVSWTQRERVESVKAPGSPSWEKGGGEISLEVSAFKVTFKAPSGGGLMAVAERGCAGAAPASRGRSGVLGAV